MSEAYVARLRNFYARYAPEKIHTITSLVQHFPDEEKLFNLLREKYGPELVAPRRGGIHPTVGSPCGDVSPSARPGNASFPMSPTTGGLLPPLEKVLADDFVLPLILQHLRASKYDATAESLLSDCRLVDLPIDRPSSAYDSSGHGGSILGTLLNATPATRHILSVLLEALPERLLESLPRTYDEATLDALIAMARTPMWSTPEGIRMHTGPSGILRAADINSLIERCTEVIIQPHVTVSAAKIEEDAVFTECLLRWHRHFVHPHVLLAKLIQRSLVPLALPLHDTYRGYGIRIENRGVAAPKGKYLSQIQQTIGVRVLTTIYTWLVMFPMDWTETMVQCALLYLEDHGSISPQHMQVSEAIRLTMADLEERCNALPFTGSYGTNRSYRQGGPRGVARIPPAPHAIDLPTSLLAVDPIQVARQLTAADHIRYRSVHPLELVTFVVRGNTMGNVSGAPNLVEVMDAFAKLYYFTLHQIIEEPDVMGRVTKMAYFATLLCTLIECNNLQSASAVALAFCHNALSRMQITMATFKRHHAAHEKVISQFYNSIVRCPSSYKTYVKGIQDTARNKDEEMFPVIPFWGSLVRELRFLEFAEPVALEDGSSYLVHWRKYVAMEEMLHEMFRTQKMYVPPDLLPIPHFQSWLHAKFSDCSHSDEDLHRISCRWEP